MIASSCIQEPGKIQTNPIELSVEDTELNVDPCGAWITSWKVNGMDILFPRSWIEKSNGEQKLRGGMHVCFPNAGPDINGLDGNHLPQHGFGRELPWKVHKFSDGRSLRFTLGSDDLEEQHRVAYPYEFEVEYTVVLGENNLIAFMAVTNKGSEVMPVSPGFHPYFSYENGGSFRLPEVFGSKINPDEFKKAIVTNLPTDGLDIGRTGIRFPNSHVVQVTTAGFPIQAAWTDLPVSIRQDIGYHGLPESQERKCVCLEPFSKLENFRTENGVFILPSRTMNFYMRMDRLPDENDSQFTP